MKKAHRRVQKNFALRKEMIDKGLITPPALLAIRLKARGFVEAAKTVNDRVVRGKPLFWR